ncbi:hypothetical protein IMCC9480_931 [Oxalobacteraceae bacterium IMCC9480]|nr:hypothetical protein IMCC9480_931 [Oxalobacteraceae bacterium IMCC9480]NDP57945.1 DUF3018 family protein [Oxalobacteraceae bacterium]
MRVTERQTDQIREQHTQRSRLDQECQRQSKIAAQSDREDSELADFIDVALSELPEWLS